MRRGDDVIKDSGSLSLKKSIAARDFYEDGASSCLPNSFVPRHRTKPTSALEEALEYRRRQKSERAFLLQTARDQSAVIEERNSPERIAYEVKHLQDERDEEIMVGKFMRGEHWIVNDADVQLKQTDREEKFYAASAKVFEDSDVMRTDFDMHHLGKVQHPVESSEEKKERERQSDYIHKINGRIGLFDTYKDFLHEVARLQDCVNDQEEEAVAILKEVELNRTKNDFQWQLDRNNRVKELRAKTAVDLEDLQHARLRMSSNRKEINIKYPEMSSALLFEEETVELQEDVHPDEEDGQMFRDTGKSVFGWIIGRLTRDGRVCNILFGQFSREVEPPVDGWIFVGQNIDRNLVTTDILSDAHISASQEFASVDGMTSTAESDHVLTEADMRVAAKDVITVTPVTLVDSSHKAATGQNQSEHLTFRVSGCSIYNLNGNYMENGDSCNVPKYRNLRGWCIYRVALLEIPDLGILAENCYSALKGPSISVMLDKKSDIAFMELVDRKKEVKEGTVHFKRRFAEMSRSGQRIINMDQTSQLYRNEQIRAQARSESDKMMMMILQAVSSHSPEDENDNLEKQVSLVDSSPTYSRAINLATIEEDEGEDKGDREIDDRMHFLGKESPRSVTSRTSHKSGQKSISSKSKGSKTKSPGPGNNKTNDSDASLRSQGFITGVDLDIKVTLSKGLHLQVGSQGFPLSRRESFLAEEAELTSQVTKCIEAREEEIFKLRVESEKVARAYLESHSLLKDMDVDGMCVDIFRQMRKVRESTVLTSETLGAWARLCYREKKPRSKKIGILSRDDQKSHRTYCVSIAYKGGEIYPLSKEMKSQTARWSRGLEKAKISTDTKYIGEYKNVEEALDAFQKAVSKLRPEQLLEEDAHGAKPVVGLRSCGKHFLVRSNAVPNDIPCECCRARDLAQPDLVVPSAIEDSSENLQQFIWHGVSYLEKMWSDLDFLDENVLLKKAFPTLDFKFNPLLLLPDDFSDVLRVVSVQDGKVLEYLKGRQEQIRDAMKSGTFLPKTFTDHELMGLPYRTEKNQRVDLDREAARIESEKMSQNLLLHSLKSFGEGSTTTINAEFNQSVESVRPPFPASAVTNPLQASKAIADGPSQLETARVGQNEDLPFTPWSTLSPRNALESPEIMGRIFPGDQQSVRFALTEYSVKAISWLQEDPLDFVGQNRLQRSFHILGQSATLTKHKLPEVVVPDKLKESVLKRKKILRSASNPAFPSTKSANQETGGAAVIEIPGHGTHGDDKVKTIPTEVAYLYRGAYFAMAQMRPPLAHRIDDVWCRSDVGEWKGMSKGRAMRSYEFGENVRIQGIMKNEERKRLQMMIRRNLERDIVYTDVPAIKQLIIQSKEIRGSVLALDVIQAEQFLKYRIALIKSIRKMQKMARGNSARRRVRRMKEKLKGESTKLAQTEIQSIALSRKLAPMYIMEGIASALPKLTKTRFRITVNFGGVVLVLTIRKNARVCKRGFVLCPTCQGQAHVKIYDRSKKIHRTEPAACTCRWWQGKETWNVQLFDPLLRTKKNITLTMSQVLEHIESIERAKPLMSPDYRQNALVGKSFDRLRALFDQTFVTFDGQLEHSNSLARRRAAEESCLLPLLPRSVSDEVLDAVRRRWQNNLAIDRILSLGNMRFTAGPLAVSAIDHIEDSVALTQWEPISDFEYAHRHLGQVKHHIEILETRVKNTKLLLEKREFGLDQHVTTASEWDRMSFEDARMTFIRLDENIRAATEKIERVMKYSKEGIQTFELEEKTEKLDWKQSYEEKEDGNAWEGLNNRRKLEDKWAEKLETYLKSCAKLPHIFVEHDRLEKELQSAREAYKEALEDASIYAPTLYQIKDVLVDVERITKSSIKNAVAVLTMPRKGRWPNHRRVQRISYGNVFIRDPFVRAQKENIGLWKLLERNVMALRPILKSFAGKAVLRCIVEIYQDPVTQWVLVRINQEEQAVEESMQHVDMHISKRELSDMTNSALDTDILLRPRDVDIILSKPPNWPAIHLKKEPYVFKNIDCFLKAKMAMDGEAKIALNNAEKPSEVIVGTEGDHQEVSAISESKFEEDLQVEWIPPSKRPRSLDGVRLFPLKREKYSNMPRSMAARRTQSEFKEVKIARDLMMYLRLHPYTGRPCLGLVHFVRRQNYCVVRVTKCRWFCDLAKGTPSTWCNEVCNELRYVGKRLIQISTRSCLDHFEVCLKGLTRNTSLSIVIPFQDIVENLSTNNPILLASLLCETIVNRFSPDLHNFILDYIDFQLPGDGEKNRRFWRQALFGEMPRLEFQKHNAERYRGPIYRSHRFFSGRYFQAIFSVTANLDVRIELGTPIDGNFWGHMYTGNQIAIDISRDELRAFVAKISTTKELVNPQYFGNIKLLHPNHWIELFPLLLELIILPDEKKSVEKIDLLDEENSAQDSREKKQLKSISAKVKYVMDKFNNWALTTKGQSEPIVDTIMNRVTSKIESLDCIEPWSLEFYKDSASRKLVEVRSEVWESRDLDRFYGVDESVFKSQSLREKVQSNLGAKAVDGFNENKSIKIGTSGSRESSYWSVRFLTDESKGCYLMDLRTVDDLNPRVQTLLGNEETTLMAKEEELSRKFSIINSQEEKRLDCRKELEILNLKIKNELNPALQAARQLSVLVERKFRSIGDQFCSTVDSWLEARARVVYDNACKTLSALEDSKKKGSWKLTFEPSIFTPVDPSFPVEKQSKQEVGNRKQSTMRKSSVLKTEKVLTSDWERTCQVVKISTVFPKEMTVFSKKFEKVIAGYELDAGIRTDAEVKLLSGSNFRTPIVKRADNPNPLWTEKFAHFSSSWLPRYDVLKSSQDTLTTFRDPLQWNRLVNSSGSRQPPRNESRILNCKGNLLLVSDPIVGPFDMVGFNLYDPVESRSWSLVFASAGDLPKFGHIPRLQKTLKEKEEVSKGKKKMATEKSILIDSDNSDKKPLYRLCAERIVWNALSKSTINVIIKVNVEQLAAQIAGLEEQLEETLTQVESLEDTLEDDLVQTESEMEDKDVVDFVSAPPSFALSTSIDGSATLQSSAQIDSVSVSVQSSPVEGGVSKKLEEIVHHSIQNFRSTGFGIRVYGVMIPADEALDSIPIEVFSQDWLKLCEHYLGSGPLRRRFTSSAFVWSSEKSSRSHSSNPRVNRWIEEYDKFLGWKNDPNDKMRIKKLIRSEMKLYGTNTDDQYSSDVVLLLRYGQREVPLISKWLKDRFDEYAPIRELRRQKEGREREFRISNHQKFCDSVFSMANSFLPGVEAMFNERSSINTEQIDKYNHAASAISYFGRVLLSRFLSLRAAADGELPSISLDQKIGSPTILDEAFLVDTQNIHPFDNVLLRFDSLSAAESLTDRDGILLWDPTAFVEDPKNNPILNRPDLQPRVGQVVYAIYKLHCFECKLPSNLCRFPGCRCIRQEAVGNMQFANEFFSFDEVGRKQLELKGTGRHPLEMSIRRYLLSSRDMYNQLLPTIPGKPIGLSPADEVRREQVIDDKEASRLNMIEYLRVKWKELELEGCQFRYFGKRVLRPELSNVLCAEDVLEARGGIKGTGDELSLSGDWLEGARQLVPRFAGHDKVNSSEASDKSSAALTSSTTITGALVEIPNSLVLALLGGVGVDGKGKQIPVHLIDPYPGKGPVTPQLQNNSTNGGGGGGGGGGEIERPMAEVLFTWLVDHLCVSRPKRIPPGSGERGQYDQTQVTIKLDRQLCEGAVTLLDGSLIVVQLLYGVLSSSTLCADEMSGTPPGAIRYCPSSLFHDLRPGMILLIYDMRAGVTRCTALEGRTLARAAEALQESESNIPAIARKVLHHASLIVRLSRVGDICTAVALDIDGIHRQAQVAVRNEPNVGRFRALGRKEGVFDRRRDRLRAAMARTNLG